MSCSFKTSCHVAFIVVFVIYHIAFCIFGFSSALVDMSVHQDQCGKKTHVWKYALLNVAFSIGTISTFGFFPGGGEGARARALSITILHFAFAVWGVLMWEAVSESCLHTVKIKFRTICVFQNFCVGHNCIFLTSMILHELWLGDKMGGDFTLFPDLVMQKRSQLECKDYVSPPETKPPKIGSTPPAELSELVEAAHQHFMAPLDQPALGLENA